MLIGQEKLLSRFEPLSKIQQWGPKLQSASLSRYFSRVGLIAILIAFPLVLARTSKLSDGTNNLATLFGSTPNFWLATLLIYLFALKFGWFLTGGYVPFPHFLVLKVSCLPAISLGLRVRVLYNACCCY